MFIVIGMTFFFTPKLLKRRANMRIASNISDKQAHAQATIKEDEAKAAQELKTYLTREEIKLNRSQANLDASISANLALKTKAESRCQSTKILFIQEISGLDQELIRLDKERAKTLYNLKIEIHNLESTIQTENNISLTNHKKEIDTKKEKLKKQQ